MPSPSSSIFARCIVLALAFPSGAECFFSSTPPGGGMGPGGTPDPSNPMFLGFLVKWAKQGDEEMHRMLKKRHEREKMFSRRLGTSQSSGCVEGNGEGDERNHLSQLFCENDGGPGPAMAQHRGSPSTARALGDGGVKYSIEEMTTPDGAYKIGSGGAVRAMGLDESSLRRFVTSVNEEGEAELYASTTVFEAFRRTRANFSSQKRSFPATEGKTSCSRQKGARSFTSDLHDFLRNSFRRKSMQS